MVCLSIRFYFYLSFSFYLPLYHKVFRLSICISSILSVCLSNKQIQRLIFPFCLIILLSSFLFLLLFCFFLSPSFGPKRLVKNPTQVSSPFDVSEHFFHIFNFAETINILLSLKVFFFWHWNWVLVKNFGIKCFFFIFQRPLSKCF